MFGRVTAESVPGCDMFRRRCWTANARLYQRCAAVETWHLWLTRIQRTLAPGRIPVDVWSCLIVAWLCGGFLAAATVYANQNIRSSHLVWWCFFAGKWAWVFGPSSRKLVFFLSKESSVSLHNYMCFGVVGCVWCGGGFRPALYLVQALLLSLVPVLVVGMRCMLR